MPAPLEPVYAEDFPLSQIPGRLCDEGPYLCPACEAQCAFGRRFLREIDSDPRPGKPIIVPAVKEPPQRVLDAQRRHQSILFDLGRGMDKEEVQAKYGFETRAQLNSVLLYYKKKALVRR